MKNGKFVAQESIDITTEASEKFVSNLKALMAKYFPEWKGETITRTDKRKTFHVTFKDVFTHDVTYRTQTMADNWFIHKGDLIQPAGDLVFELRNSRGYDESKTGPFYEWEKGFVPEYDTEGYDSYLYWVGKHKKKGHQYVSGLDINGHFQYGSEIDDLEYDTPVRIIAETYHRAKVEKKIDLYTKKC